MKFEDAPRRIVPVREHFETKAQEGFVPIFQYPFGFNIDDREYGAFMDVGRDGAINGVKERLILGKPGKSLKVIKE